MKFLAKSLLGRAALSLGVVAASASLAACGGSEQKYDISPIFPLSSNTCAKYHGKKEGSGFGASCLVNKKNCEKAAADWRAAMASGGVNDAILFTCN